MRNSRTYRGDRKRRAKAMGLTLEQYAAHEARAKELAARRIHQMAMDMTPDQARAALALWAKSGGKINVLTGEGVPKEPEIIPIPPGEHVDRLRRS